MFYHAECLGRDQAQLIAEENNPKNIFRCNSYNDYYDFERAWGKVERRKTYHEMLNKWRETAAKRIRRGSNRPKMNKKLKKWIDSIRNPPKPKPKPTVSDITRISIFNTNELPHKQLVNIF